MLRKQLLPLFIILLLGLMVSPAMAQIIPPPWPPIEPPPPGGVLTNPDWLNVDYHRVTINIDNQVAETGIDIQFTNEGEGLVEGTFVFPLPANAAVDRLTMFIDGQAYDAKILDANEARSIYDEIVRRYRDPALLEYIGTQAVQANIFPIPAGESRRVQIDYTQLLEVDNGLFQVVYPMTGNRIVDQMSIGVTINSETPISSIYSPSHNIAINREGDNFVQVGFEQTNFAPDEDFTLYYGIASDTINVNLLSYRESANADGFFLLLVQPPVTVDASDVVPKDVILVLDQSGSMSGEKWDQARAAATYVLENLNAEDRFNLVVFSTGLRVFSNEMEGLETVPEATHWIDTLVAEGGTDINAALLEALGMVGERPATILFLTDGEPTEGETDIQAILGNVEAADQANARIFSFGVGDDVNTVLLDTLVRNFRGTGSYVRPSQQIDEQVASLYNKISAPVLSDVTLNVDGVIAELLYPNQLSDLFAGEQIALAGRYRGNAEDATITLSGTLRGEDQTYIYNDFSFRERAGGEPFIARLWATRRIADLLNTIRLEGEDAELIDSVVNLSVRYGIITPYTSFLIEEDDILTQQGRERAFTDLDDAMMEASEDESGAAAVQRSVTLNTMSNADAAPPPSAGDDDLFFEESEESGMPGKAAVNPIQAVGEKTFILLDGVWTDTLFEPETMETEQVIFLSNAYFALLDAQPDLAEYLALGDAVIVVYEGMAYQIVPEDRE